MKKLLICILCLFSLCACSQKDTLDNKEKENQTEEVKSSENNAVVLNNNILKPGDKLTDINEYLDNYESLETESSAVFYSNEDIEIFVGMDKTVKKITLLTSAYTLDNDIKVGSSIEKIKKIYKNATSEHDNLLSYHVDHTNITFTIKNNKISLIELEIDSYT